MLNVRPSSLFGSSFFCLPSGAAIQTFIFSHVVLGLSVGTGNEAPTDLCAELPWPLPGSPSLQIFKGLVLASKLAGKFPTGLADEASLLGNG